MAFPNAYIGDIVATTLENRSKKAADNVTRNSALLNRISKRLPPGVTFPIDSTPAFLHGHCGQRLKSEKTVRGYRQFFPPVAHDHYGDCTKENLVAGSIIRSRMQG